MGDETIDESFLGDLDLIVADFQDDGETSCLNEIGDKLERLIAAHRRLQRAVIGVISIDRLIGGAEDEAHARKVELQEGDSVMVADLLRGLGVPVGDYP